MWLVRQGIVIVVDRLMSIVYEVNLTKSKVSRTVSIWVFPEIQAELK